MTTQLHGSRPGSRIRGWEKTGAGPSVREVALVGLDPSASDWRPGDRVERAGRTYRVAATQARIGSAPYVHLMVEPVEAP